eukprot:gnl/TRDRNA2_/TRDRNA2_187399_c0_seq1.p1 gnl/TRDRNA2_/TRDRNA2_187399_c0~~gnl/TRDRNA2_/TRDRNA2_187399_c0_seq1.p1  ORF type:complete len:193 (-),score=6.76 gnl/TRDRNA2_/TRDRNA2_187399_c0_seq1:26-604(-)
MSETFGRRASLEMASTRRISMEVASGYSGYPMLAPPTDLVRTTSEHVQPVTIPDPQPTLSRRITPGGSTASFLHWPQPFGPQVAIPRRTSVEIRQLDDEVKKRANQQVRQLYLNNFIARQELRMGGRRRGGYVQPMAGIVERRQKVCGLAQNFDEIYGSTQDVMKGRLVFEPPARRHTITVADVNKQLSSRA